MNECYRAMRMGVTAPRSTATPFLADFTRLLSKDVAYFRNRKVALLIDDFSVHRLPRPVQLILNVCSGIGKDVRFESVGGEVRGCGFR